MLILSRMVGESIMIGDDKKITVLGIKGHQVRIGVGATGDKIYKNRKVKHNE